MVDRIIGGHNHHEHDGHDHAHEHHHEEVQEKKTEKDSQITQRGGEKKVERKPKDIAKYDKDPQQKEKKTDRSAILYLVADFLHNFIDGIGIGVAFTISKWIKLYLKINNSS